MSGIVQTLHQLFLVWVAGAMFQVVVKIFVGYCFHSVAGYSKIGSYTGNGTGQSIVTGFEVDYVLIKGISFTTDWMLYDQKRGNTQYLIANVDSAEGSSGSPLVEFYTNGFGVTTSNSENKKW